ncbi:MAG: helix-turn-helix domain-containing protein, partial [Polyangiaceae bacterium]|nr:helix-turn-helix domain-containing protein [Polyangiaceae bacterium]
MFTRQDPLPLTDDQRKELTALVTNWKTPQAAVFRARIVLMAADGKSSGTTAKELLTSRTTVQKWKSRFACLGIPGILEDAKRTGRPKKLTRDEVKEYVDATILTKPRDGGRWTVRTFAEEHGLNRNMVQRIWTLHKVQPRAHERNRSQNVERPCDSLNGTREGSNVGDCDLGPASDQASSIAVDETHDIGSRDNPSDAWPGRSVRDRIPQPVLDALDGLISGVLNVYSDGGVDQDQNAVTGILATLNRAIEDSIQNSEADPLPDDSPRILEPSNTAGGRFDDYVGQLCDAIGHVDRHKPLRSYMMGL